MERKNKKKNIPPFGPSHHAASNRKQNGRGEERMIGLWEKV